jgi:riboflavin-specific deaminase-like protein
MTGMRKLPYVLVNMAMTADGKIATANRHVGSFGSQYDHLHLLQLRAQADAVMVGARTVEAGPITLGPGPARFRRLRLRKGLAEYNLRVIVSGTGSVDPQSEVFQHRFSPIIVLTTKRASASRIIKLRLVADVVKVCGVEIIDFPMALRWLREQWQVNRLLCEGGSQLNGTLFAAGLVDELHLTLCPKIFGGRLAPTIAEGAGILHLADATQFELTSARRVGSELCLVYRRARADVRRL